MENEQSLYDSLIALDLQAFPKICPCCGAKYENAEEFIEKTQSISRSTGLKSTLDDDSKTIVELFRNCTCGSTLMHNFNDRRDNSETGQKRRKLWGELIDVLMGQGLTRDEARAKIKETLMAGDTTTTQAKPESAAEPATPQQTDMRHLTEHLSFDPQQAESAMLSFPKEPVEQTQYQELLTLKERFELALNGANEGIWDWDLRSNEVWMSPRWKSMLGYEETELPCQLESWQNNLHPDDLQRAMQAIADYLEGRIEDYEIEFRMRHKDSHYIHILSRGSVVRDEQGRPYRFVGTHVDITRKRKVEDKLSEKNEALEEANRKLKEAQSMLLQQEKMASIGQLAAGVAHEINNPVGFIQSNVGSLKSYVNDVFALIGKYGDAEASIADEAQRKDLEDYKEQIDIGFIKDDVFDLIHECQDGLDRIIKIVRDLKDFSHVGEAEWETTDIMAGIESTLNIVHNELKYKANIRKEIEPLPPIACISSQLNQVFMNLLVNAGHAIDERGDIVIRAGVVDPEWIFVEVEDNGHGIPEQALSKIFDPFFTTKPVGKGTGLGLSLAYGIIEKHNGKLTVKSQEGEGTRFRIELPVHQPES